MMKAFLAAAFAALSIVAIAFLAREERNRPRHRHRAQHRTPTGAPTSPATVG